MLELIKSNWRKVWTMKSIRHRAHQSLRRVEFRAARAQSREEVAVRQNKAGCLHWRLISSVERAASFCLMSFRIVSLSARNAGFIVFRVDCRE